MARIDVGLLYLSSHYSSLVARGEGELTKNDTVDIEILRILVRYASQSLRQG